MNQLSLEKQDLLAELMDQYMIQLEQGADPNIDDFCREHPDLADEIRHFAETIQQLQQVTRNDPEAVRPLISEVPLRAIGDYQLVREIGRGGMGVVYEATQVSLERRVALKILPFAAVLDSRRISRFQNEAQAAAQLHHPNIIPVYAIGQDRGTYFYSMQFIDGQSIEQFIQELRQDKRVSDSIHFAETLVMEGSQSTETASTSDSKIESSTPAVHDSTVRTIQSTNHIRRVAELGQQVAAALHYAHDHGIVHRDIKPSNLLIDQTGKIWIADFGLAQCASLQSLTQTGDLLGTIRYMSPEQAAGKGTWVDHRTDIYSLGATLYELLTLKHLVTGSDRVQMLEQVRSERKISLRKWNPNIPHDLETILLKGLSHNPADRYQTALEFATDLERFLAGQTPLAKRPSTLDLLTRWVTKHSRLVVGGGSLLVLMVVAAIFLASWIGLKNKEIRQANGKAVRHLAVANQIVEQFGSNLLNELSFVSNTESLQKDIALRAINYLESFKDYAQNDPGQRKAVVRAMLQLASLYEREGDISRAVETYASTESHWEANPAIVDNESEVLRTTCRNNFACLLVRQGRFDEALAKLDRGLLELESPSAPNKGSTKHVLQTCLLKLNRCQVMFELGRTVEAHRDTEQTVHSLQSIANAITQSSVGTPNFDRDYRELQELMISAILQSCSGEREASPASESLLQLANRLAQSISESEPNNIAASHRIAICQMAIGSHCLRHRRASEAVDWYDRSKGNLKALCNQSPGNPQLKSDFASACNNLGRSWIETGDLERASSSFQEAVFVLERLSKSHPDWTVLSRLGGVLHNQAAIAEHHKDFSSAKRLIKLAIERQRQALAAAPDSKQCKMYLQEHEANLLRLTARQNATEGGASD